MSGEDILVLGHPFAPIGMGEHMRATVLALQAVGLSPRAYDIYRQSPRTDPAYRALMEPIEATSTDASIRIFHINGDEVEPVVRRLEALGFDWQRGHNIVSPAWELAHYPEPWAKQIDRFDSVWAMSRFVAESLRTTARKPVTFIGEPTERPLPNLLPRSYFGIRESSFVFLTSFDYSSYKKRKNPEAAVEAFRRLVEAEPLADVRLVIKVGGSSTEKDPLLASVADDPRITVIDRTLDTREMMSLMAACDCLVSLPRSEGFGRSPAEAMLMQKTVIACTYGGLQDYVDDSNALTVNYKLIPLEKGDYPFWEGEVWANPDVAHVTRRMHQAWSERDALAPLRARARMTAVERVGNRAVGLRMLEALNADRMLPAVPRKA